MHVCTRLGITRPRYGADGGVNSLLHAMPTPMFMSANVGADLRFLMFGAGLVEPGIYMLALP